MQTVKLTSLMHREAECIGIYSEQNATLNFYYKKAGARWSKTKKCWYVPCTETNYEQMAKTLKGKAILDTSDLKKYLTERRKTGGLIPQRIQAKTDKVATQKQAVPQPVKRAQQLSPENTRAMQAFNQQLILKSYSPSTIKTYTNEFMQFLQAIRNVPAHTFTTSRIKDYLQHCF